MLGVHAKGLFFHPLSFSGKVPVGRFAIWSRTSPSLLSQRLPAPAALLQHNPQLPGHSPATWHLGMWPDPGGAGRLLHRPSGCEPWPGSRLLLLCETGKWGLVKVCWEGKGMEFSGGPVVTGTAMSLLWCGFDPLASEILHAVGAAKKNPKNKKRDTLEAWEIRFLHQDEKAWKQPHLQLRTPTLLSVASQKVLLSVP